MSASSHPRPVDDNADDNDINNNSTTPSPASLLTWFTKNGGRLHPNISIHHTARGGFHLRALETLEPPFHAVSCPLHLSLSVFNLAPPDVGIPPSVIPRVKSALTPLWDKVHHTVLTCLLLIEQLILEELSPWYPYIATLPEVETLVSTLYPKSTKYIESTVIPAARDRRLAKVDHHWQQALAALEQAGLKNTELYDECDRTTFRWADAVLCSRAFASTYCFPFRASFQMLFPVFDIANHSPTAHVQWNVTGQAFHMRISDRVEAGEQVYNNYGPKSNSELLLGYGFAIPNNPVDQVPIPILMEKNDDYLEHVPFGMDPKMVHNTDGGLRLPNNLLGRYDNQVAWLRGVPPHVVFACYIITLKGRKLEPKDIDASRVPGRIVLGTIANLWRVFMKEFVPMDNPYGTVTDFKTQSDEYQWIYMAGQVEIGQGIRNEILDLIRSLQVDRDASVAKLHLPMVTDVGTAIALFAGSVDTAYATALSELMKDWLGFDLDEEGDRRLAAMGEQTERAAWAFLTFALHAHARRTGDDKDNLMDAWARDLDFVDPFDVEKYNAMYTEIGEDGDGCTPTDGEIRQLITMLSSVLESRPRSHALLRLFSQDEIKAAIARACHIARYEAVIRSMGCDGMPVGRLCMYMNPRPREYKPAADPIEPWVTMQPDGEGVKDRACTQRDYEPFTS
ncbi:SET domain-containing protein [Westerdykella ornata]|uniref:SET domain-containing protein n=1 Tax=Westerdykella ornata TaxID=318751 RepID=A0A6A6J4S3_WESOR|nr:SET domain-containing protein [Westerdykella ornata]KAF2271580.1 SET domain-containing protein [Westerdykella ornata]